MVRPVPSTVPITLGYRQRARFDPRYVHRGIDFGCGVGTPVAATRAGQVVYAGDARKHGGGYGPAYGIQVVIRVGNIWCLYAHLSQELVDVGETVKTGQQVGKSGATGNVRGAHLHYQENTQAPAAYKSDRSPQFLTWTDGPVDRFNPDNYGPGHVGPHIRDYGSALVRAGFGDHYKVGPSETWGYADQLNTRDFQLSEPKLRGNADGLPGPLTLKLLLS